MSGCDVDRLEALIEGTLDGLRAGEARAHLAGCARCAEELRRLREERRLFRARAATFALSPPPFAAVLAEVRPSRWGRLRGHDARPGRSRPRSLRRLVESAPWLGLAAAAAIAVFAAAGRDRDAPSATAEPPPSLACYDDPRSLVAEATAYATDRAIASAEDLYAACLVATPRADFACALPVESDVTCGSLRPPDDEVFESRIRGGSLQ